MNINRQGVLGSGSECGAGDEELVLEDHQARSLQYCTVTRNLVTRLSSGGGRKFARLSTILQPNFTTLHLLPTIHRQRIYYADLVQQMISAGSRRVPGY